MKRRLFAFLMAAVMLLNAFPAHALESGHSHTHTHNHSGPTFVVDTVTAAPGEAVDVTIRLENNPGITSIKLELEYAQGLTLTGVTSNPELGDKFLVSPDGRYPVILNWYDGMKDVAGDWVFVTLHFAVATDAAEGSYSVTIDYDPNDVFDFNEDNVAFDIENGAVVVGPAYVPVTGVSLNVDTLSLTEGESAQLTALVSPENATNKAVSFASSDISVATVDANGYVSAVGAGTAVITVTADGGKSASCTVTVSCGHGSKTEVPARAADCENPGNARYYICDGCGQVFKADGVTPTTVEAETIPATGHGYEAVVTAPTCTEQGYTTHTCRCGDSYVDTYVAALGHSFTNYISDNNATCDRDGTETATCDRCDATDTRTDSGSREDAAHSFPPEYTPDGNADCTADGTKSRVCPVCGEKETVADPGSALGHAWDNGVVTKEPTETETGIRLYTCTRCGETRTAVIPTIDHVHDYEAVVTEPTCTEQGYTTHTCRCGDSYVDSYVPALGHDFGAWTVVTEATCTENGSERRDCGRCDHYEAHEIPATGHNYEAVVTEPTCTEQGYTTHTCANCGDIYVDTLVAALGHAWDDGVVTKEPTETESGIRLYTCTRCGETRTAEIPTIDHVHDYEAVVTEPTCTEQGYTTHTCAGCGDSYVDSYVLALGHDFGAWTVVTEATCTEKGSERRNCSRCDHFETREIPALGHQWIDPDADPRECGRCGHTEPGASANRVTIPAEEAEAMGATGTVWIDGVPYSLQREGDSYRVELSHPNATTLVVYTYNDSQPEDIHTQYPVGMKVWRLTHDGESYTATYVPELDDLLQYAGSSIRIVGNKGIRMITAITRENRDALTKDGLAGYTLVEYGTALCRASALEGGNPMVLGGENIKSNYAYRKGVADPIFKRTATHYQYTNVLVGFTDEDCKDDIAMRPYIILEDENGSQVTIYGGIVYRSIGYIAYQNRDAFRPRTAAYNYVWNIIHYVYGDRYDEEYKG